MNSVLEQQKAIAILGFGNPVREDDGVGVYVVQKLKDHLPKDSAVEVFDMGTSAFEVLFRLKGKQQVILIDAVVNSGEKPGTLFRLPASEIKASIQEDPLVFLHGLKWDQALSYAKKMLGGDYPEDITVFLIAVNDTRFNLDLSTEVRAAGDRLVQILTNDLIE